MAKTSDSESTISNLFLIPFKINSLSGSPASSSSQAERIKPGDGRSSIPSFFQTCARSQDVVYYTLAQCKYA